MRQKKGMMMTDRTPDGASSTEANMSPERIWLQDEGHSPEDYEVVTWCVDPIDDSDTEYVRADLLADLEAENVKIRQQVADAEWLADEFYSVVSVNVANAGEQPIYTYNVYDRQGLIIGDYGNVTYWGAIRAAREAAQ